MTEFHSVQLVAITFDDGSVGVMSFILDPRTKDGVIQREATPEAVAAEIAKSVFTDLIPVSWRLMSGAELPADRAYRNAWHDPNGKGPLQHDMIKAAAICKDKLREARQPALDALDLAYIRADEIGDLAAKQAIVKQKQELRDLPSDPRIDAAKTIEELKAIEADASTKTTQATTTEAQTELTPVTIPAIKGKRRKKRV